MKKLPLPDGLGAVADAAQSRLLARQSPPRVKIERTEDGWAFSSPYADDDGDRWIALLADAFGTRSGPVIDHFLAAITELVPDGVWDGDKGCWYPLESDFNGVLAIISAHRPQNEAQAAYAAQLAALHLASMRLGKSRSTQVDPRSMAIMAKVTRAYGDGMERLARMQGRVQPKTTHQFIQVQYNDSRSVNFNGEVPQNGGQAQGRDLPEQYTPAAVSERPALPSSRPHDGEAMHGDRSQGQAGLSRSWWGERLWRAIRGR